MKNIRLFVVLLWACFLGGVSEAFGEGDDLRCRLYFPLGSSRLDLNYKDNEWSLEQLLGEVRARRKYSQLERIVITSGASPEGNTAANKRLSDERCEAVRRVIEENLGISDLYIETVSLGEDWDGLARLVEESDMIFRNEVLEIIRYTPIWIKRDGKVVGSRKQRLMNLYGGTVWRYMERNFFPELRNGSMIECKFGDEYEGRSTTRRKGRNVVEEDTVWKKTVVVYDTVGVYDTEKGYRKQRRLGPKPFFMTVKTNMLYDALLVPNVGVEFWLGQGWTIGGSWEYAWWKSDRKHNYWRVYGGEIDVRKYFGWQSDERIMSGHHLGLYAQMLTYDFELGATGYMGGEPGKTLWQKPNYAFGLEYGYSMPLNGWMNLDFSIGIGYMGGSYWKYEPNGKYYLWKENKQVHWFGPTKAEISLIWILGTDDCNRKKGNK